MAQPAVTATTGTSPVYSMARNAANAELDLITNGAVPTQENLDEAAQDTVDKIRRRIGAVPEDLLPWLRSVLQERIHKPGSHFQLVDRSMHTEWFLESGVYSKPERGAPAWKYWNRYRAMLLDKGAGGKKRDQADVDELDRASNAALACLMDPSIEGRWDILGMVVGNVQSGKTQHFGALMNKAADVGYKLIVILAGTTKDLRWQTQRRIDEDFRGRETWNEETKPLASIGVGHFNKSLGLEDLPDPESWTQSNFNSEFGSKSDLVSLLGKLSHTAPVYMVVKKNVAALRKLKKHFENLGRETLAKFPTLVIDDECDHASPNTRYKGKDAKKEMMDEDPTKINAHIRQILELFDRRSYVGYTATPFANVFIPYDPEVPVEKADLYPKNFIMTLDPPSSYVGADRVFGLNEEPEFNIRQVPAIGMVRYLPKEDVKKLEDNEKGVPLTALPESLRDAVLGFCLATAANRERQKERQFATMLVHVAGTNNPQSFVYQQLAPFISYMKSSLVNDPNSPLLPTLRHLWETNYVPYSQQHMAKQTLGMAPFPLPSFDDLLPTLRDEVGRIQLKLVNQTRKEDILDYSKGPVQTPPYIAIGGNKLSRGFTMEGLHTSYYVRSPDAADTLMQMGRWFGYRPSYLDLCRVHTTKEIEEKFQYIANATAELRLKFKEMHQARKPPSAFAYEVREHPAQLIDITAGNKQRFTKKLVANLRGRTPHTLTFDVDDNKRVANLQAVDRLLSKVVESSQATGTNGPLRYWLVESAVVLKFLDEDFHVSTHEVNPYLLSTIGRYIRKKNGMQPPELSKFWVAVHEPPSSRLVHPMPSIGQARLSERNYEKNDFEGDLGYMRLNALEAPEDLALGMNPDDYRRALAETRKGDPGADKPSKDQLLAHRDSDHGVLVLYFIDPVSSFTSKGYSGTTTPLVGFMVTFPRLTRSGEPEHQYRVGHVAKGKVT